MREENGKKPMNHDEQRIKKEGCLGRFDEKTDCPCLG